MSQSRPITRAIAALAFAAGLAQPAGAVVVPPESTDPQMRQVEVQERVMHGPGLPYEIQGHGLGPMMQGGGPEAILRMLRLTPEQQAKFQALHLQQEKDMIRLRAETAIKRLELEHLLTSPDFKEADVRAKHRELEAAQAQERQRSLDALFQLRALLTPEQRARLPMRWMLRHMFSR